MPVATRTPSLDSIAEKVWSGERLSFDDGLALFRTTDLTQLAALANLVRQRKHPGRVVTFNIGRNINYTNVCWVRCRFCAFYRIPGHGEGYVLPTETILQKVKELVDLGGREVLIQGGLNPKLTMEYYQELLGTISAHYEVDLHAR